MTTYILSFLGSMTSTFTIDNMFRSWWVSYTYGRLRTMQYYLPERIQMPASIDAITPNIYVGDVNCVFSKEFLKSKGITHIVSGALGVQPCFEDDFKYLTLDLMDLSDFDIQDHFHNASDFMYEALKEGGKVLVHCMAGRSRSATLLSAYFIKYEGMSTDDAIKKIRIQREVTSPNLGFVYKLRLWENEIYRNKEIEKEK